MTPHFRAPMRSRRDDVDRYAGVERGLALGLCGVGGRLEVVPPEVGAAVLATEHQYGEHQAQLLGRFIRVPEGAVVWTRAEDQRTYRGILEGPWSYDADPAAYEVDLVHVRPCTWTQVTGKQVPAAVHRAFGRGGRNFQRITALSDG
ncbi:hypothetical protein ABIE44_000952 [Marmoricola sp. OAE513]|uniref:GAF domain-containing protein n=1 Tax=Marmoricola sp. OAE513 TaxID=2817894 RepID=UPI001AE57484